MLWLRHQSSHSRSSTSLKFVQEFKSAILSRDVKIIVRTASSTGKTITSRHLKKVEAYWAQASMGSRHSKWRSHITRKSTDSPQCIRCAHKVCSSCSSWLASSKTQPFQRSKLVSGKYCSGVEEIAAISLPRKISTTTVLMKFYQEYVSKFNTMVSALHKVRFVCWISTHFRIIKGFSLKDSEKRQFESDAHSRQFRVKGARVQNQVIQAIEVKIICSIKG